MNPSRTAEALRVLIVDDSRHFLKAARAALEQDGVNVIGVASSSAEALKLAPDLGPDLILVDVDLGDESGLDLARQFAAIDAAPVILISAYPASELAELIAASPVLGFVSKSDLSAAAISQLLGNQRLSG
jgi:DNA-binding NarL/FixJ family response regulator